MCSATGKVTGSAIIHMKDLKAAKAAVGKGAPTVDRKHLSVALCNLDKI